MAQIHTSRFRAMGSSISLWLEFENQAQAERLLQEATGMFAATEQQLSRFRASRELSQLNSRQVRWIPVSSGLWRAVKQALRLANETHGRFDPTLLKALQAIGYDHSFGQETASPKPADQAIPDQYNQVRLDKTRRAIWLPDRVCLNLGGFGKGYTAQQVVTFLNPWGACLVDAGGDITAGRGPAGSTGWPVAIALPERKGAEAGEQYRLLLERQTVASSATDYRQWQRGGQQVHHIIDPRTGRSSYSDILSVTVLAGQASRAVAWATAALVTTLAESYALLADHQIAASFYNVQGDLYLTPALKTVVQIEPLLRQQLRIPLRNLAASSP